jgi:DNA processing protein
MDMPAGAAGARGGIALTDRQRLAWLRLIRSDNVGPATFRELINHFGTAEAALQNLPELARRGGAAGRIRIMPADAAEREMEAARRFGAHFIGIGEPDYPPLLRSIDGPPPLLAIKGNAEAVRKPGVALVGSRNASVAGMKFAARLAREIAGAGYTIVSGLARGIDAAAHRASLDTGTIAAMAGGLDRPYPPENLELYDQICGGAGLAVSEMPFGWEPRARDFPRRNRLIAGMVHGLVVVEAAARSGSLISARRAADFGRLVFAVPGSPLDPRSTGTNALIKDGAILTTEARDVIEALAPSAGLRATQYELFVQEDETALHPPSPPPGEDERQTVVSALGATPVDIDDIIRHTGLAAPAVHLILLELDLAGRLRREAGGAVALAAPEL